MSLAPSRTHRYRVYHIDDQPVALLKLLCRTDGYIVAPGIRSIPGYVAIPGIAMASTKISMSCWPNCEPHIANRPSATKAQCHQPSLSAASLGAQPPTRTALLHFISSCLPSGVACSRTKSGACSAPNDTGSTGRATYIYISLQHRLGYCESAQPRLDYCISQTPLSGGALPRHPVPSHPHPYDRPAQPHHQHHVSKVSPPYVLGSFLPSARGEANGRLTSHCHDMSPLLTRL
ncbi:hypothetical protein LX36DRAFT_145173 [Colletotrichum falcatum]|nr:hypothetical protein LX36DRAFT_145173 [Colletotrichum falcatum]